MYDLKHTLSAVFVSLAIAAIPAHADTFTSGNYYSGNQNDFTSGLISFTLGGVSETGAAGNIANSSGNIGGTAITFSQVFCVDIPDTIYLNTTYTTSYNQTGAVDGKTVNNAGEIAWMLENLAPLDTTTAQNEALQAAIWSVEYGSTFVMGNNGTTIDTEYANDLSAASGMTAAVSGVYWISPYNSNGSDAQAQVGLLTAGSPHPDLLPSTPEPDSLLLLGTGLSSIGVALRLRGRKKA